MKTLTQLALLLCLILVLNPVNSKSNNLKSQEVRKDKASDMVANGSLATEISGSFPLSKHLFVLKRYFDRDTNYSGNVNWDKRIRATHDPATKKYANRGAYEFDFFLKESMAELDINYYLPGCGIWHSSSYQGGRRIKMMLDESKIAMYSTNYDDWYLIDTCIVSAKVFNVPAGYHNIYLTFKSTKAKNFYSVWDFQHAEMINTLERQQQYVEMTGYPFQGAASSKHITPFREFNQKEIPAGDMIAVNPNRKYFKKVIFPYNERKFLNTCLLHAKRYSNTYYKLLENPNYTYNLQLKEPLARLKISYHLPYTGIRHSNIMILVLFFDDVPVANWYFRKHHSNDWWEKDVYLTGTIYNVEPKNHKISVKYYVYVSYGVLLHNWSIGTRNLGGNRASVTLNLTGDFFE